MEFSTPIQHSEDYLVQQAIKRDETAFTTLYRGCVERVYRHIYYKVSDPADAQDITQEAFIKAWNSIETYKNTGTPFIAWVITIANNLIIDHYRKDKRTIPTVELHEVDPIDELSDPAKETEVKLENAFIKKTVLKLKGDKQKVILMHFIDGMTYEEIAKALNKSEGSIRVIQYRALGDLRKLLRFE